MSKVTKTSGLPGYISRPWLDLNLNTVLIRFTGLVALLSIPFKHVPHRVESLLPFQPEATSHILSFCLGLSLLYVAGQITMRKLNAWYVAVTALSCLIIAELLHFRNPLQVGLYAATLASIIKDRREFVVRSDVESLRRGLLAAAVMIIAVLLFAGVTFELIDQRAYGRDLTTGQTLSTTWHALTGGQLPYDGHLRRYDRMLVGMLRVSGVAIVAIIGYSLFRPLRLRRRASAAHRADAAMILQRYSNSSEDFFKLWPQDKHYFFYGDSFAAYKLSGKTALLIEGVSGNPQQLAELRRRFEEFVRLNGWSLAIIHADEVEAAAWQEQGFNRLFIGSEAVVDCTVFVTSTTRNKHFRYVANKAAKEGLQFEIWPPPLSVEQIESLRHISDSWLQHGRREYTFLMGYFDEHYMRECQVAILTRAGKPVAYANFLPTYRGTVASIDHMRFLPGTASVAMHYLLRESIEHAYRDGATHFNLGLVPLSKLQEQLEKTVSERLLTAIKSLGSRYYSFEGLEQFKGKFEPEWTPRYILYRGAPTRLVSITAALNSAMAYRPAGRDWTRWFLIGLAALAGFAYAAFPLAYWLNPVYFWHGEVSNLGRDDQAYAWLFNSLDISSTLLGFVVLAVIAHRYWPASKLRRAAVLAAFVGLCGTVVAATIALPPSFDDDHLTLIAIVQPRVLLHGLASFINSAGFVVSVCLWAWPSRRHLLTWRPLLAIASLLLSSVGALIGMVYEPSAPSLQRLFILCYAAWFMGLTFDVSAHRIKRRLRYRRYVQA